MDPLQQRVPLKDPQTFPRPLVVLVASNAEGQGSYTVSDFDPETGCGLVAVAGNPGFDAVRAQVEHVAALMMADGGYQGKRGGGLRVQMARDDGSLYFNDDHYIAESGAEELLMMKCVDVLCAV